MNSIQSENNAFNSDKLLFSIVILHEASSHDEMIPEIPDHLMTALGASSVLMALVGLSAQGSEIGRVMYASAARTSAACDGEDWVKMLLHDHAAAARSQTPRAAVTCIAPDGVKILFELDGEHAVAFRIVTPAAVHLLTESGHAWMLRLLGLVARNLRARIIRPCPRTRSVAPLNELTEAEWRVLLAMDCSDPQKEIAPALGVSKHTLHTHMRNVYRTLKVRSRQSAIELLHRAERQSMLDEFRSPERLRETLFGRPGMARPQGRAAQQPKIASVPEVIKNFGRSTPRRVSGSAGVISVREAMPACASTAGDGNLGAISTSKFAV